MEVPRKFYLQHFYTLHKFFPSIPEKMNTLIAG
jgi:hypothetical protein